MTANNKMIKVAFLRLGLIGTIAANLARRGLGVKTWNQMGDR